MMIFSNKPLQKASMIIFSNKPLQKQWMIIFSNKPFAKSINDDIFQTNQSHEEALAAHQAAENAVRAAAGQVKSLSKLPGKRGDNIYFL